MQGTNLDQSIKQMNAAMRGNTTPEHYPASAIPLTELARWVVTIENYVAVTQCMMKEVHRELEAFVKYEHTPTGENLQSLADRLQEAIREDVKEIPDGE